MNLIEADVFDILSAAWVLACNDENPIITYRGLRYRLDPSGSVDVEALIRSRGDLFRQSVSNERINAWKSDMRSGKHRPSWIRELSSEAERLQAIEALQPRDVFRSQFRTTAGAPPSSIKTIDWGLQHIDRLRKAKYEAHQKSAKSWQMWLVFAVALANFVATSYFKLRTAQEPPPKGVPDAQVQRTDRHG